MPFRLDSYLWEMVFGLPVIRKITQSMFFDFIVERKEVTDLDGSIEDNRYKDQKFRMQVPSELAFASTVVITYKP